ncbi:hypothetical protein AGLY_002877, partial [Aphis glycines]
DCLLLKVKIIATLLGKTNLSKIQKNKFHQNYSNSVKINTVCAINPDRNLPNNIDAFTRLVFIILGYWLLVINIVSTIQESFKISLELCINLVFLIVKHMKDVKNGSIGRISLTIAKTQTSKETVFQFFENVEFGNRSNTNRSFELRCNIVDFQLKQTIIHDNLNHLTNNFRKKLIILFVQITNSRNGAIVSNDESNACTSKLFTIHIIKQINIIELYNEVKLVAIRVILHSVSSQVNLTLNQTQEVVVLKLIQPFGLKGLKLSVQVSFILYESHNSYTFSAIFIFSSPSSKYIKQKLNNSVFLHLYCYNLNHISLYVYPVSRKKPVNSRKTDGVRLGTWRLSNIIND